MQGIVHADRAVIPRRMLAGATRPATAEPLDRMLEGLAIELLPIANAFVGRDGNPTELMADTLSRVYERYDQLADKSKLLPWARQILVRRFIDGRRRLSRARRVTVALVEANEAPADRSTPDADEIDLRRALARLPREQLVLVVSHYWGGFTLREIAEALDIPEGTAKSRLHATLARLRHQMGARR